MADSENEKQEETQPRKKRAKSVDVRVIHSKGGSSLVEWRERSGLLHRCYVPVGAVEGGNTAPQDVLEAGIPYGVQWEELLDSALPTPISIANELRAADVWTLDDLETKANAANGVFKAINNLSRARILAAAKARGLKRAQEV